MCTVTLIARRNGYALGMNRDEKLSRVCALPPKLVRLGERKAIFPSEPSGGAWIGVNDCGLTLALINWYSVADRVRTNAVSRGEIIRNLLSAHSLAVAHDAFASQPLSRINPFRLIGISNDKRIVEWRWDLRHLAACDHPWRNHTWISSGFDEPGAQRSRGNLFAKAQKASDVDTIGWLRRLHSSHEPRPSPYSTCMHRQDAATVSYSEIEVLGQKSTLRYTNAALCCAETLDSPFEELILSKSD